jgi:hypothetical protein
LAKSENFAASFRFRSALVNWFVIHATHAASSRPCPGQRPPLHKSPRPTLTQTQRLRGRRCGREREFLRLLCAGHCGLRRRPRPGSQPSASAPSVAPKQSNGHDRPDPRIAHRHPTAGLRLKRNHHPLEIVRGVTMRLSVFHSLYLSFGSSA